MEAKYGRRMVITNLRMYLEGAIAPPDEEWEALGLS
jgi:hypothetical protein